MPTRTPRELAEKNAAWWSGTDGPAVQAELLLGEPDACPLCPRLRHEVDTTLTHLAAERIWRERVAERLVGARYEDWRDG